MDLTRTVSYRGFLLNDPTVPSRIAPGVPISGCVLDGFDLNDVDVVQFHEKRAQKDGLDTGDVWHGARRIRLAGTLYGVSRADLFDRYWDLRRALNPVLAQREEPADKGYRPLLFSTPTNRAGYAGTGNLIELIVRAMPRAFSASTMRDTHGGEDADSLAIPWQATLVCRDPSILSAVATETMFTSQTEVTGATAQAAGDTITRTGHGLVNGTRVRLTALTGGAGLNTTTTYWVVGAAANTFQVSLAQGGAAVDITTDATVVSYVVSVTNSGSVHNRGTYIVPVNALWSVRGASGQIAGTIGDAVFTIDLGSSVNGRVIRFKGEENLLTVTEVSLADPSIVVVAEAPRMGAINFTNRTTWPFINPGAGQPFSFTTHGLIQRSGSRFWFHDRYA